MSASAAVHPSDETLSSYGLGKLDDLLAEEVGKHLERCESCRCRVSDLSSDSFLGRIREAQARPALVPATGSSLPEMSKLGGESRSPAPAPPPAGTLPPGLADHPDYEILREFGRGGMGVVYLAENRLMGRKEVLKVVSSHLLNRPGVRERFLREIRLAAQLDHPNVVTAFAARQIGDSLIFSMKYVEGYDLAKLVQRAGPLLVAQACNFVYQAALGLQHAHEHGMVHRDIKPSNLMLTRDGNKPLIKVLDFGLAKAASERGTDGGLTQDGQMLGTPHYVAPEQTISAQKADIRADIYSLGCTLYCLLAGHPPFDAPSLYELLQAHHSMDAKPLNFLRPEVPAELAAVVAKMLAKEPERRFQTPKEVAQALRPFFKSGAVAAVGSKPDISQVGPPKAQNATPGAAPTPPLPAAAIAPGAAPAARKPSEPTQPGSILHGLIDLREPEPLFGTTPDAPPPAPTPETIQRGRLGRTTAVEKPRGLGPRGWWAAAGLLLLGLVVVWAAVVYRIKTKNGVIVLEELPRDAEVFVDGERIYVAWPGGDKPAVITVAAGRRGVEVQKGGCKTFGEEVSIEAGDQKRMRVRLEPRDKPSSASDAADRAQKPSESPARIPPAGPLRRHRYTMGTLWAVEGEQLIKEGDGRGMVAFGDPRWTDYDLTFETSKSAGPSVLGGTFRESDGRNYGFTMGDNAGNHFLGRWTEPTRQWAMIRSAPGTIQPGVWYKVKISLRGQHIRIELNDQLLFNLTDDHSPRGYVTLSCSNSAGRFRNIKITAPDGTVLWQGPPDLGEANVSATVGIPPAEKTPSPPTRLVHVDEFGGPRKVLPMDPDVSRGLSHPSPGQSDGVHFAYSPQGWHAWPIHDIRTDGTCEVVSRVLSDHPSKTAAWLVIVQNAKAGRGFLIKINLRGEFFLEPSPWGKEAEAFRQIDPRMGPIAHPAIKPGNEFNKLLLLLRRREVVILVNGVQVCDPVRFEYDITPSRLCFGAAGPGPKRAEFDRLEIREMTQPDDKPPKAEATASATAAVVKPADRPKPGPAQRENQTQPITNSIGKPANGLLAEFFEGREFGRKLKARVDANVDWLWGFDAPDPELPADNFSARWTGWLKAPRPGRYKIIAVADDGVRLWLDGNLLIDEWHGGYPARYAREVDLTGNPQALKLDYLEVRASAVMSLRWEQAGRFQERAIPSDSLFLDELTAQRTVVSLPDESPAVKANGLEVEFFEGTKFGRKLKTRIDTQVDWLWGWDAPDPDVPKDNLSARWTGWMKAPRPGRYKIIAVADDGVRLWLDGQLVIDAWKGQLPHRYIAEVDLTDKAQTLKLEYFEVARSAIMSLRWQSHGGFQEEPIPATAFFREGDATAAGAATNSRWSAFGGPRAATVTDRPKPGPIRLDNPPKSIANSIGMKLVLIPAGAFVMGSPETDNMASDDEKPEHPVRISRPFYLGVTEVTQAQFMAVRGYNPSYFSASGRGRDQVADQSTDGFPVEQVTWLEAVEFCNKLSEKEGQKPFYEIHGNTVNVPDWNRPGYRLPTEAEWEYACRANSETRYSFGDDPGELGEYAWYKGNSGGRTHPVGQRGPNDFGLFDMHGNVWEWCWDGCGNYEAHSPVVDPLGLSGAAHRVERGGAWPAPPRNVRSARRMGLVQAFRNNALGFRLARAQSAR